MSIEVEGAKELARLLRQIGDKDLQRALRDAHKASAAVVRDEAQQSVPVRSGRLRSSLKVSATQKGASVRAGSAKVPYAATIAFGRKTGNVGSPPGNRKGPNVVKGRPFLTSALDRKRSEVVGVYRAEIEKVLRRIRSAL